MRAFKLFLKVVLGLFIFLCIFPYLFSLNDFQPDENYKPFPESKYAKIDQIKIHYRLLEPEDSVMGNILLVHGFSGSTFSWRNNIDTLLKQGFRVLLADLPAFGYSDRSAGIDHGLANRAKLLWKLIEKIGLGNEEWNLTGHSMGAGVVLAMASAKPANSDKIILVDGAVRSEKRKTTFGQNLMSLLLKFPPVVRWISLIAEWRFYNYPYFKDLLGTAYSQVPDSLAAAGYLAPFKIKRTTAAILESFRSRASNQNLDYKKINVSIYLIWGYKDKWVPLSVGKEFTKTYRQARLIIVQNAGHCPMETHPQVFNREMAVILSNITKD